MVLTNFLVPAYSQMLIAMSGWLQKAQEQLPLDECEALMSARLAPDMFPLSSQIRFACLQVQEATFRLRCEPLPAGLDDLAKEGFQGGDQPGSMADARARIDEALSRLRGLAPEALDAGGQMAIPLALPNGMVFDMTGEQYARDWAQAQFYFPLVTACAILRSHHVVLGKADYVPHMFAYLRPGTLPQS
ncbi:DUF1993 domain-containing protein [Methylobacterium sp. BTF04]|nr:DUF1993 domain-containing protein [Methylobacterium sp. BTF04]